MKKRWLWGNALFLLMVLTLGKNIPMAASKSNTINTDAFSNVAKAGFAAQPRWWARELRSLQVRCSFDSQIPANSVLSTCKTLVGTLAELTGNKFPVRLAPELNAGLNDTGRATFFFNVALDLQKDQTTIASSLVVYRYDLADQLTTGLHSTPQIRTISNPDWKSEIHGAIVDAFKASFGNI